MITRTFIAFFILSFFLHPSRLQAQLHYKAKTITTLNGLSDNRVTCFHKDRKGFMWIGTKNGLNRYDGHSFRVFRPSGGNSISNEVINDIAEDSQGRIWVATMGGLNILDQRTGNWEAILSDPVNRMASIPNQIIWDISIDKEDRVWIVPDVFEFCSYDTRSKKFSFYDWPSFGRNDPGTRHGRYRSIQKAVPRNSHEWWLGTTNGLVLLDTRTGAFRFIGGGYYADVLDLEYDPVTEIVLLSSEKGRFFRYDSRADEFREMSVTDEPYPSAKLYGPGRNEIWMASETGLVKVDDERKAPRVEKNIPQLSGSLLPGGTRSVFEDDNHIRWVATPNGISVYDLTANPASFLPLVPVSDKEGSNRMGGVYYDSASHSYFVCSIDPAAVFIIDTKTGGIRKLATDASGNALSFCTRIKRDRQNDLWLLTGHSVYRYDRTSGQFVHLPAPNKGTEAVFRDMVQDAEGNYWFGTFNDGVYYYHPASRKFMEFTDSTIRKYKSVTGLATRSQEAGLMISTFGEAVMTYDNATGEKKIYAETSVTKDYFHLYLVNDIHTDDRNVTWLATHAGGVFRYNPGMPFEKSFTQFDMRHGLKSNNIISVTSNNDSVVWLLSGDGISAMSREGKMLYSLEEYQTFSFSAYGSDSRYPHNIFFSPERNELLVGAGGGLFMYTSPGKSDQVKFPMAITKVLANERVFVPDETDDDRLHRLPFSSNAVSFEFAGLYYGSAANIRYEYRLSGFDKEWRDAGRNFLATYQNLPSGNYRFYARARDGQGRITAEISGFSFRITPPFWRRWWFLSLIALLLITAVGFIIRSLRQKLNVERAVTSFATSLYGQNTTEDILWDTAKNCIEQLGFVDCVIYQRDETREVLLQKAAYGPKNPQRREIANIIEIKIGEGIVGAVAKTGKPVVISDTTKDKRYIVDDEERLSEIAVPVIVDGKVFAVIDSEHPKKDFYNRFHLRVLRKIAAICSERITKHLTEERLRAKIARDLHDEMGSTLTSINIISKVAMEGGAGEERSKEYFQKIKDHSGRMMESMSDMVWAINPVNDSFGKVILRMKEFAAEILEPARITYYFDDSALQRETTLNPEQRKNIYLIFKEAVNNVVKYSQAQEVNIIFALQSSILKMMISDNGIGFDLKAENSGNGLRNMQVRAAEMGGSIRLESIPGTGTSVTLELTVT